MRHIDSIGTSECANIFDVNDSNMGKYMDYSVKL